MDEDYSKLTALTGKKIRNKANLNIYDKSLEMHRASYLKQKIETQFSRSLGSFAVKDKKEFEMNLVDFCLENKISLLQSDYRDKALNLAARQHPSLDPLKKKNHRPKKTYTILTPSLDEIRLRKVDAKISEADGQITQKEAITRLKTEEDQFFKNLLVEKGERKPERSFGTEIKTLEIAISKQRKIRQKQNT